MGNVAIPSVVAAQPLAPRGLKPFIALEGLDGTGKTTIGRRLAEKIDAVYLATPPEPYCGLKAQIVGTSSLSRIEHFLFYAAALVRASIALEELLREKPVVVDRYVASTAAYHTPYVSSELVRGLRNLPILMPDAVVLLVADESQRSMRLVNRDGTDTDGWFDAAAARALALSVFRRFATFELDTTGKTPEDVVACIVHQLHHSGVAL